MSDSDNKFARMIDLARKIKPTQEQSEIDVEEEPKISSHFEKTKRERGRPATGKRSNDDYVSTTVFLRKTTKKSAAKLLLVRDDLDLDLSDLLENLLANWINENT